MADDSQSADGEAGPSSEHAPAQKKRHMGVADPHAQTQAAAVGAVHAAHAEPAGSTIQMFEPAAAVRRCVCLQEKHDSAYAGKTVRVFIFGSHRFKFWLAYYLPT